MKRAKLIVSAWSAQARKAATNSGEGLGDGFEVGGGFTNGLKLRRNALPSLKILPFQPEHFATRDGSRTQGD